MNRFLFIFACAFTALAQFPPSVQVTTNGALVYPTNFFTANSNLLNAAVSGSGGDVTEQELTDGLATKQDTITGAATTITGTDLAASRALISNSSGKVAVSSSVSDTELGYLDGVTSALQTQIDAKQPTITGSATSIDSETITASRLVVTDASGKIAVSATTSTEAGYVSGVTSSIQTQLDGKQATITGSATTIDTETLTADRALITDGSGKVAVSSVTSTEIGYLGNVTSDIQAQIDAIDGGDSAIFITPQDYGADGTDTTDDRSAFEQAWGAATSAQPKKILYIPEGTYYLGQNNLQLPKGLHIIGGKGAVLKPISYPTGYFNTQDKQNTLIHGDDNVTIGGELTIDMRNDDASFTQNQVSSTENIPFSGLKFIGKTNINVSGLHVRNAYDAPLFVRECTNVNIVDFKVSESAQISWVGNCVNVQMVRPNGITIKATNSAINGVGMYFSNNKFTKLQDVYISNVIVSNLPSEAYWTSINLFGEDNGIFSGITLDGINTGTTTTANLGLNLDGGVWNTIANFTIKGYHHNAGSGLQIEGAQDFIVANGLIDGVKTFGPGMSTAGGDGIYMTEWGIESADKGGFRWRNHGHQWRGRSLPARGRFTNVKVRGFHNGVRPTGTDLFFDGCEFTGANFACVRILPPVSSGEYYSRNSVDHKYHNIVFNNCEIAWGKSYGVALSGGDQIKFIDCNIHDNNQDGSSYEIGSPSTASGNAASGSTSTVIIHGLSSITTDLWKGLYAYFPSLGLSGRIENNSSTTFTLTGSIGVDPTGSAFVINRGLLGRVTLQGCQLYKTSVSATNQFSLDPTQDVSAVGNRFSIEGTETHMLHQSQIVTLKGVLSGNTDMNARVLYKDADYPDRVWLETTTGHTGTFQSTAGTAIVAGTGTMSYTDNPTSFEHSGRLTVTGSGTSFGTEMDGSWWFKALDQDWQLSSYALTDTTLLIHIPYDANFSAKTFLISRFSVVSPTRTGAAIDIRNTPGQIFLQGTTVYDELVNPASGGDVDRYYPAMAISSSAPNARSKLTGVFPRLGIGPNYIFSNPSGATTVTNLNGGSEGMEINILGDANTTLGFAESDTSLVGNGGSNKTLGASKLVRGTYRSGKWYLTVIE